MTSTETLPNPDASHATDFSADLVTRTGFRFHVRPATQDDEEALADFFTHVTPQDIRFRFLTPLPKVGHAFLERMTKVDHDRTEDFLAFTEDGKTLIATAMLAADEAKERAEVAISIRTDYKRRGIGWRLLEHVSRYAEAKGIKVLESIECRENREAIQLEREMGFTATSYPGDPTLVLVQKRLGSV
ncbi:MAG TPA: GNAT family N-acetyltransferase [Allosphingosinicella sp.]|uniref:GNAT family N-acetyltransferase n=1 Tax=Allosphingosinicella sp. TaxID=2823234 RepID=UPI002ED90A41